MDRLRQRVRVEQARQSLDDAHRRLDAALLALNPGSDNVIMTAPLLGLVWDAVVARRHLRLLEDAGEGSTSGPENDATRSSPKSSSLD
jgi:hypothetical protein